MRSHLVNQRDDRGYNVVDREFRGVDGNNAVGGGVEVDDRGVLRVAPKDRFANGAGISPVCRASGNAGLLVGSEQHSHRGVRSDDRGDVPALGNDAAAIREAAYQLLGNHGALHVSQYRPRLEVGGHLGDAERNGVRADERGYVLALEHHAGVGGVKPQLHVHGFEHGAHVIVVVEVYTLAEAREPIAAQNEYAEYASGWSIRPFWELRDLDEDWDDGTLPEIWEHYGTTQRSFTYLGMQPEMGLGIVLLANTGVALDQNRVYGLVYGLLHEIANTQALPIQVDPLIAIAPVLIIAAPLLGAGAIVWLAITLRHRPRSRIARWAPVAFAGVVVIGILYLTLIVVPARTGGALYDTWWWTGVPDLAVSTALMLLLSLVATALMVAVSLRQSRSTSP